MKVPKGYISVAKNGIDLIKIILFLCFNVGFHVVKRILVS
jgi:hypothetical protein